MNDGEKMTHSVAKANTGKVARFCQHWSPRFF